MDTRKWARVAALVVVLLFTLALVTEYVDAAAKGKGGDAKLAQKKGGLASKKTGKEEVDPRAPKSWQVAMGIGSVFVAFVVIKWL